MAYLAQWPEWLHACVLWWMTAEPLAGYSPKENCIYLLCFHCRDCSPSFIPLITVPVHHLVFFLLILILCYFLSLSTCLSVCLFFLFLSASPPLLCQHFTLDIQLLAGHSIVIPFSAGLSARASNSHSNYILGCLQSCRSAKCCFQTFLGPPPNLISQT